MSGITVREDCANKRRIYKLGMGYLRNWVCGWGLRCAKIAQIRGGFINWEWEVCETGLFGCAGITVRADCANKRRIYKLVWEVCETGYVGGDYGARRLRK